MSRRTNNRGLPDGNGSRAQLYAQPSHIYYFLHDSLSSVILLVQLTLPTILLYTLYSVRIELEKCFILGMFAHEGNNTIQVNSTEACWGFPGDGLAAPEAMIFVEVFRVLLPLQVSKTTCRTLALHLFHSLSIPQTAAPAAVTIDNSHNWTLCPSLLEIALIFCSEHSRMKIFSTQKHASTSDVINWLIIISVIVETFSILRYNRAYRQIYCVDALRILFIIIFFATPSLDYIVHVKMF